MAFALARSNNIVEMRLDASKLVAGLQRPSPRLAEGIGPWAPILMILTLSGAVTNAGLMLFIFPGSRDWFGNDGNSSSRILAFFALEHGYVLMLVMVKELSFGFLHSRSMVDTTAGGGKNRYQHGKCFAEAMEEAISTPPL